MNWLIKQIRKEEWSPYVAGALLGIVGILTVVLAHQLLGASGGFENLPPISVRPSTPAIRTSAT